MPRSTKEVKKEVEKKSTKKVKKVDETPKVSTKSTKVAKKTTSNKADKKEKTPKLKKSTTTKKTTVEKKPTVSKKTATTKKSTAEKKTTTSSKKTTTSKKTVAKKESTSKKKTTIPKSSTTKKASTPKVTKTTKATKTTAKKATSTRTKKAIKDVVTNLEYYDLPYRYNKTMVKILTQTPNTLFIYWDISDDDRRNLQEQYGENFFNSTKPVLVIHNETKNYSYEVEINDFANSWYLHISDTDCKYTIELGRKYVENKPNEYIYISSSNDMVTQNDHIYGFNINDTIQFKNIKDNTYYYKKLKDIPFIRDNKLYKELLKEFFEDSYLNNPSSNFLKIN